MTILTLNLRFGLADDGANNWAYRKKIIPKLLDRYPADFYCFQEANDFQIAFIKDILKGYGVIGRRRPAPAFWQNNVIFFRRPWECRSAEHFFLSATPTVPSRPIDSKWPRQCTLGEFASPGRRLVCINTHFDFSPRVQKASARLIADRIAAMPGDLPVIVCGDFNSSPGGPAHAVFTEPNNGAYPLLENVFSAPYPGTHHGFTGRAHAGHIDWILYRGNMGKQKAVVISDDFDGMYPSDHFPVTASFSWASE